MVAASTTGSACCGPTTSAWPAASTCLPGWRRTGQRTTASACSGKGSIAASPERRAQASRRASPTWRQPSVTRTCVRVGSPERASSSPTSTSTDNHSMCHRGTRYVGRSRRGSSSAIDPRSASSSRRTSSNRTVQGDGARGTPPARSSTARVRWSTRSAFSMRSCASPTSACWGWNRSTPSRTCPSSRSPWSTETRSTRSTERSCSV